MLLFTLLLLGLSGVSTAKCTNKPSFPAGKICGNKGSVTVKPNHPLALVVGDRQTLSLDTCRDWCSELNGPSSQTPNCLSIGYNTTSHLCRFLRFDVTSPFYEFKADPKSDVAFYSLDCFNCPAVDCQNPETATLFNNGGFEQSKDMIGPWYTFDGQYQIGPGHNSAQSLRVRGLPLLYYYQGICPGVDYLLSMDVKAPKISSKKPPSDSYLGYDFGDCFFSRDLATAFPLKGPPTNPGFANGTWRTLQCSLQHNMADKTQSGTSDLLTWNSALSPTYELFLDNVKLKPIAPVASLDTVGPSLVRNGGFESGVLAPWSVKESVKKGNFSVVAPGLGNSSKHKFEFVGEAFNFYQGTVSGKFVLSQTTTEPVKFGKLYVFTVRFQAFNATSMFIGAGDFRFARATSETVHRETLSSEITTISRIFTGSGEKFKMRLSFSNQNAPVANQRLKVFIDDISIRELANQ